MAFNVTHVSTGSHCPTDAHDLCPQPSLGRVPRIKPGKAGHTELAGPTDTEMSLGQCHGRRINVVSLQEAVKFHNAIAERRYQGWGPLCASHLPLACHHTKQDQIFQQTSKPVTLPMIWDHPYMKCQCIKQSFKNDMCNKQDKMWTFLQESH